MDAAEEAAALSLLALGAPTPAASPVEPRPTKPAAVFPAAAPSDRDGDSLRAASSVGSTHILNASALPWVPPAGFDPADDTPARSPVPPPFAFGYRRSPQHSHHASPQQPDGARRMLRGLSGGFTTTHTMTNTMTMATASTHSQRGPESASFSSDRARPRTHTQELPTISAAHNAGSARCNTYGTPLVSGGKASDEAVASALFPSTPLGDAPQPFRAAAPSAVQPAATQRLSPASVTSNTSGGSAKAKRAAPKESGPAAARRRVAGRAGSSSSNASSPHLLPNHGSFAGTPKQLPHPAPRLGSASLRGSEPIPCAGRRARGPSSVGGSLGFAASPGMRWSTGGSFPVGMSFPETEDGDEVVTRVIVPDVLEDEDDVRAFCEYNTGNFGYGAAPAGAAYMESVGGSPTFVMGDFPFAPPAGEAGPGHERLFVDPGPWEFGDEAAMTEDGFDDDDFSGESLASDECDWIEAQIQRTQKDNDLFF